VGHPDQAFEAANYVVECKIDHPRLAPSPLEPRSISVSYDATTHSATIWHATQTPHRTRSELAAILSIESEKLRVVATHVGGAFGMKASLYPEEVFAVWAAFRHKRDVQWVATRSDDFLSATHGRGLTCAGRLALDGQGKFLALQADITAPIGAWLPNSGLIPAWNAARILPSGYTIASVDISTKAVQNGNGLTGIYRGAGRPEANMLMERLIDKAARATGIDPMDLRTQNLVPVTAMPHDTPTGETLDSGDYAQVLDMLKSKASYLDLLKSQTIRRAQGELVGIGTAFYLEPSGSGWESARVTLHKSGRVTVASGSSSQGHGRETAFAKIAAGALRKDTCDIEVLMADTAKTPEGIGALASRSTAIGGSAVLKACLQASALQEQGKPLPITVETRYENEGQAWGYGAYLAVVSVCGDTGVPTI
jgi:carbon-monoxide dehydrogenase large subunit